MSSIVRATDDDIRPTYTEKRLSRNLDDGTLEPSVARAVLNDGVRFVKDGTLLLFDPTEIRKEYARAMEHVTLVRDASRSSKEGRDVLVNGYHGCMAAACRVGGRKTVPLALKLWSSRAPGVKGENDEVLKVMRAVYEATGGKGVTVYDRGGDRPAFGHLMNTFTNIHILLAPFGVVLRFTDGQRYKTLGIYVAKSIYEYAKSSYYQISITDCCHTFVS